MCVGMGGGGRREGEEEGIGVYSGVCVWVE